LGIDGYRTYGATGGVRVALEFDDGRVERERSKRFNGYRLALAGAEQEFDAIGSDVPEEVVSFLALHDCCTQAQHDRHFLLQDSPGEVARQFNEAVGLGVVDGVLARANQIVRETSAAIKGAEEDARAVERELEALEPLDDLQARALAIRQAHSELSTVSDSLSGIEEIVSRLQIVEHELQAFEHVPVLAQCVSEISDLYDEYVAVNNRAASLLNLVSRASNITASLNQLLWVGQVGDETRQLAVSLKGLEAVGQSLQALEGLLALAQKHKRDVQEAQKSLVTAEAAHQALVDEVGGVCPLCGGTGRVS